MGGLLLWGSWSLFYAVVDDKELENYRGKLVYIGGEGHGEVKYQAGEFVPLSNCEIDATKEYQLYAELL